MGRKPSQSGELSAQVPREAVGVRHIPALSETCYKRSDDKTNYEKFETQNPAVSS